MVVEEKGEGEVIVNEKYDVHSFRGRRSIVAFSASVKTTPVVVGDLRCGCVHTMSSSICSLSAKSALIQKNGGDSTDATIRNDSGAPDSDVGRTCSAPDSISIPRA